MVFVFASVFAIMFNLNLFFFFGDHLKQYGGVDHNQNCVPQTFDSDHELAISPTYSDVISSAAPVKGLCLHKFMIVIIEAIFQCLIGHCLDFDFLFSHFVVQMNRVAPVQAQFIVATINRSAWHVIFQWILAMKQRIWSKYAVYHGQQQKKIYMNSLWMFTFRMVWMAFILLRTIKIILV